jgi:endonuclease YncB( thermonuclease family)
MTFEKFGKSLSFWLCYYKCVAKASKKKRSFKKVALVVGAVAIIAGSVGVVKRVITPGEKVVSVIDGDSFKIGRDQTIRLSSLDAPELKNCAGNESKVALTKEISGKTVILKELKTDHYGRVMAMVYLRNGENVNEYMVKNGLALHIWDTSSQNSVLDKANDFARENALGIFSPDCYQKDSPNPKCSIKGNIIQGTKAKEYILPTCNLYSMSVVEKYKGETWFCTEAEAKAAGYTRSSNCK